MSCTSPSPHVPKNFSLCLDVKVSPECLYSSLIVVTPPFGATKGLKVFPELLLVQWVLSVLMVQVCLRNLSPLVKWAGNLLSQSRKTWGQNRFLAGVPSFVQEHFVQDQYIGLAVTPVR